MSYQRAVFVRSVLSSVLFIFILPFTVPAQQIGLEAILTVESEPSGAEVFIDGSSFGFTPVTLKEIRPGIQRLTLRLRGYEYHENWVFLPAGEKTDYAVTLQPLARTVAFTSDSPYPLEVYLQGKWRDAASVILAPGNHDLRFRSFGFAEIRQRVVILPTDPEGATTYRVELSSLQTPTVRVETLRHVIYAPERSRFRSGLLRLESTGPVQVNVTVRDAHGRSRYEKSVHPGDRIFLFDWEGSTTDGEALPPGSYTVEVMPDTGDTAIATSHIRILEWTQVAPFILGSRGTGSSLFHLPGTNADAPARIAAGAAVQDVRFPERSGGVSSAYIGVSWVPWGIPVVSGTLAAFAGTDNEGLPGSVAMTLESPELSLGSVGKIIFSAAPALSGSLSSLLADDFLSGNGTVTFEGTIGCFSIAAAPMIDLSSRGGATVFRPAVGSAVFFRQGHFFTALSGKTTSDNSQSVAADVVWYPLSGPSGFQFSCIVENLGGDPQLSFRAGIGLGMR